MNSTTWRPGDPIDYTDPNCSCSASGMGRHANCKIHGEHASVLAEAERLRVVYNERQVVALSTEREFDQRIAQKAWDALVDFIEANDLNYTKHDPRGPLDA